MDCLIVNREELAEKYLQGKLDSARQDEFETHLVECAKCLRELELLQTIRQDLAERAHEIRGWTARKGFFFRWKIVAIAAVVMILIAGSIAVRLRKQSTTTAHLVVSPEEGVIEAPAIPGASQSRNYISFTPAPTSRVKSGKKRAERAAASGESLPKTPAPTTEASQIHALPMDGRPYIEFPLNVQAPRDAAPPLGPAPTSRVEPGKTAERASASSESAKVKGGIETSKDGQKTPAQVGEERPKPDVALSDTHEKLELTTAQDVELKNLGSVDAPPPPFELPGMMHQIVVVQWGSHKKNKFFQQGMTSGMNGNYREAEGFLEQAAKVLPKAGDVRFWLGICQLLNGDPQTATDTLKQATAMNFGDKQAAHYYLAKGYVQIMKLQEAEDEFRTASEMKGPLGGASASLLDRLRTLRARLGTK
jgi:hypothetical protein